VRSVLRFLSRISIRLLAFNLLLVFLPAAGVLFLDTYENQLLDAQERAMVQQGRVLAAALAGRGELDEELATEILRELDQRTESRLRVVDRWGTLLADTSRLGPRLEGEIETAPDRSTRETGLYRIGSLPFRLYRRYLAPPAPPMTTADFYDDAEMLLGREVKEALAGRYGATTRISASQQRSVTLYSALPVRDGDEVVGAVLVSRSTYRILQMLYAVRLAIFKVFLASVGVAVVLSLLVSTTIARPLVRLRNRAEAILDRRGRLTGRFRRSERLDEIGDLARALHDLTRRLDEHITFIESFAEDLAHEFKNPLAAIRTATEMAAEVQDPADRRRFLSMVENDVARLERLLSDVREITRIDAMVDDESRVVDLDQLVSGVVQGHRLAASEAGVTVDYVQCDAELAVRVPPDRIVQVLDNLLANAVSFTAEGGSVEVLVDRDGHHARVRVLDEGPGIPEGSLERVFDRFYSDRPEDHEGVHSGLGLAIARTIVTTCGGTIVAMNRPARGAVLTVRLPLVRRA
jgi:two-component system sensor histidine kinase ChvG